MGRPRGVRGRLPLRGHDHLWSDVDVADQQPARRRVSRSADARVVVQLQRRPGSFVHPLLARKLDQRDARRRRVPRHPLPVVQPLLLQGALPFLPPLAQLAPATPCSLAHPPTETRPASARVLRDACV